MALGPIPWTSLNTYADYLKLTNNEKATFFQVMRFTDATERTIRDSLDKNKG